MIWILLIALVLGGLAVPVGTEFGRRDLVRSLAVAEAALRRAQEEP